MKTRTAFSLALLMTTPIWAAESTSSLVNGLAACAAITGEQARLACFDREVAPLVQSRATPALAPAPTRPPAAAVPAAPPATSRPLPATPPSEAATPTPTPPPAAPSFGNEQLSASRKATPDESGQELHAHITELRKIGSGGYLVALDNGQAWRHDDEHLGSYLEVGEAITIRRAALGSYRLTRDAGASRNWIRVTRIR